ncbi:hypothetical protein ES703_05623 [subsurface metagenome]|nr:hypothetical protein [bacterium]
MAAKRLKPVIRQIIAERYQSHATRLKVYDALEKELGRPVVAFFTSFVYPVLISDDDADMLEGVLRSMDLSKGLALVISSPGGSVLAAERIINACRGYSNKTENYWAIVPRKAKSAATMVCFGASKIIMSDTSELGPVDPQTVKIVRNERKWLSVCNIIKSYENLFVEATRTTGNIQPYLLQLAYYDPREIEEFKASGELSEDIVVKSLKSGMMKGKSENGIKKNVQIFLTPERTKKHGRPIWKDEALACGLNI